MNRIKTYLGGQCKVLDDANMILDHCISDDGEDRDGDDIALDAWDMKNYMMNPIVLDSHDWSALPVGKCLQLYTSENQLRAKTQFAPTDRGRAIYELYKGGFMNAFSVGFKLVEFTRKPNTALHVSKAELLEYSCVAVPSNPRALKALDAIDLKAGAAISKANRDLIEQAISNLQQVLGAGEDDEDDEDPEEPKGEKPEEQDDKGLDALLLAALKAPK